MPKHPGGRPRKYNPELHPKLARAVAWSGMIDKDIAKYLDIAESTLHKWKNDYPEFSEALNEGKADPNGRVKNALFQRAIGYEHEEDKIFNANGKPLIVSTVKHYPPDATSMIFWLKNRDKENWRDKQEFEHSGEITNKTIDLSRLSEEELKRLEVITAKLES